jgi:predicted amidohydrolase YtcJ
LDAACTTHPVAFLSARRWALNSLGFRTAGFDEKTQEVPGGRIVRDATGSPRLIAGGDAFLRRFFPWPKYDDRQTLDALERLLRRYNEVGITSINERAASRDTYRLYRALGDRGCRRVRVTLTFRRQMHKADDVTRFVEQLAFRPGEGDDWVKIGALKITVDGGIHWGTASLSEPYGRKRAGFYVQDDPAYRGEQYYRVDEMQEVFAAAHRLGWQMCCHVTGDAGVTSVLDALEAANRQVPLTDRRFTLLHTYFPTPQIAERCKRLGVCVDTHPYLYHKDSDTIAVVYGRSWAERFIGLGDWLRAGIPVALSSDHMEGLAPDHAMNSFNPFLQVYLAVSRCSSHGHVYGPQQEVSRIAALRMVTTAPAYLDFNEAKVGSLEPGKLADLAVLDRDVLTCPEAEIRHVKVLLTMVAGKVVFERK